MWKRSGADPTTSLRFTASPEAFSDTPIKLSLLPILPYTQLQVLAHRSRPSWTAIFNSRRFLLFLWPLMVPPACLPQAGLSGNPPEQGWPSSSVPPTATQEEPPAHDCPLCSQLAIFLKVTSVHLAPHPHSSRDLEAKAFLPSLCNDKVPMCSGVRFCAGC